ncbi:unnamed protein product, partial [Onchocerca ochengi]
KAVRRFIADQSEEKQKSGKSEEKKRAELSAARTEDERLRTRRSCSAASDLLRSAQNESERLRVVERRQRETGDQPQHDSVFSKHAITAITIALHFYKTQLMIVV